MSSNDTAIEVTNLGKSYNIYRRPQDRLKQSFLPRLQRLAGRSPNRYFHEFWALQNVTFDVRKGETVGIIGRNGSGKSTLLQIICGTLSPTRGKVSTQGRIAALLELGSGFNPEFTGRENVYLNGAIVGLSREEIDARFDAIADFADIGEFIEQPVKIYSSGMAVRLAFAVQAMVDPDILIVDEALAVGDEKFRRKCYARLEDLRSKGTSILFVSHSGPQIVELCQRVLLLEHGARLLFTDPMRAVRAYQKLIYAPAEEQKQLVEQYQSMDKTGIMPTNLEETASLPADDEDFASFDSGLIPQTTEVYPQQGAEIQSFRILDSGGRPVNVLRLGQDYQFEVAGQFRSEREDIFFGIHIRTTSGAMITGQRYPESGNLIKRVREGESFRIKYGFQMNLLPGTYFVSGGVWSSSEPTCLHRVMDALMFRVLPVQKLRTVGYVDLSSQEPVLEIF